MSPLYLYNGKLLVKDEKLATNSDCCCEFCGCKLAYGTTDFFLHTSSSPGMGGLGDPNFCTITQAGMIARGIRANQFMASNVIGALDEVKLWLQTIGYCVEVFCNCCVFGYPESLEPEDPSWALQWPCISDAVAGPNTIEQLRIDLNDPDLQVGECYLFRVVVNPDPWDTVSLCDTDPIPCPHCCKVFGEPAVSIRASCCNNCGNLGPLVNFIGTVEVTMPEEIFNFGTSTSTANQQCNPAPPASNCYCNATENYPNGGFTIGYIPKDEINYPGVYYMTATARLCRNNACCIGPSGSAENPLLGPPGTCSYAFATETECECRDIPKTLCCILHTREVRGSLNGDPAADKIDGIKTDIGTSDTIDYCPGGVYMDIALEYNPSYGSGNYRIDRYNTAYTYYKTNPDILPGWQLVGSNYVYTGVGAPSPDTVLTLGGRWVQGDSTRQYTWTPAGGTSFDPNLEISESAEGDPFYCKWKSKEYYYEWRWVSLANTYTCGAPSGDSDYLAIASSAEPDSFYCGAGSSECLTIANLQSTDGRKYFPLPEFAQRLLNNPTEQQCGPQWGTWQNGVCGEIDCGQQLP